VDVGIQVYIEPEVGIRGCFRARLGTSACLGQVVTRAIGACVVLGPLQLGNCPRRRAGTEFNSITIEGLAVKDDCC